MEIENCNTNCNTQLINKPKIPIKRYFLPALGIIWVFFLPGYNKYIHTPLLFFMIGLILFWNFPMLVTYNNSKPLYFEELFLDIKEFPTILLAENAKERYRNSYTWVLIVTNSALLSFLSEYWIYKTTKVSSLFEIMGVTGGILKLFQVFNHYSGVIVLKIIKKRIEKDTSSVAISP